MKKTEKVIFSVLLQTVSFFYVAVYVYGFPCGTLINSIKTKRWVAWAAHHELLLLNKYL